MQFTFDCFQLWRSSLQGIFLLVWHITLIVSKHLNLRDWIKVSHHLYLVLIYLCTRCLSMRCPGLQIWALFVIFQCKGDGFNKTSLLDNKTHPMHLPSRGLDNFLIMTMHCQTSNTVLVVLVLMAIQYCFY